MSCGTCPNSGKVPAQTSALSGGQVMLAWSLPNDELTPAGAGGAVRCANNQHWVAADAPYCAVCAGEGGVLLQQAAQDSSTFLVRGTAEKKSRAEQPIPEAPPDTCPQCGQESKGAWACPNCHAAKAVVGYTPADMAVAMGHHPLYNPIVGDIFGSYTLAVLGERRNVVVQPHNTSTDMQGNIYLDTMPLGPQPGVTKNLATAFGSAEHEIGHEKYTPVATWKRVLGIQNGTEPSSLGAAARHVLTHVYNIVEDGRMERRVQAEDPYGYRMIEASTALLMSERAQPWTRSLDSWQKMTLAMLYEGLPTTQVPAALVKQMNAKERALWSRLQPMVQEAVRARPERCADLAVEIAGLLEKEGLVSGQTALPAWLPVGNPSAGQPGGQPGGQAGGGSGGSQSSGQQSGQQGSGGGGGQSGNQPGGQQSGGGGGQSGGQQGGQPSGQQGGQPSGGGGGQPGGQPGSGGGGGGQPGGQPGSGGGGGGQPGGHGSKNCPYCGAFMPAEADVCPTCGNAARAGQEENPGKDQGGGKGRGKGKGKGKGKGAGAGSGDADDWNSAFGESAWSSVESVQADVRAQYEQAVVTEAKRHTKAFGRRVAEAKDSQAQTVPALSGNGMTTILPIEMPAVTDQPLPAEDLATAQRMVTSLRKLQNKVKQTQRLQRGGQLDRTRLVAARAGSERVFKKMGGLGKGKSRAWSLVFDGSSSIQSAGVDGAMKRMMALMGTVLDELHDPFEMSSFTGGSKVRVHKSFSQPWAKGRAQNYTAPGGTTYEPPLTRGGYALASREEDVRLLLFVTDGEPGEDQQTLRKKVVDPLRSELGTILVPVYLHGGNMTPARKTAMDTIFGEKQWLGVTTLDELPDIMYRYLEKYFVTD